MDWQEQRRILRAIKLRQLIAHPGVGGSKIILPLFSPGEVKSPLGCAQDLQNISQAFALAVKQAVYKYLQTLRRGWNPKRPTLHRRPVQRFTRFPVEDLSATLNDALSQAILSTRPAQTGSGRTSSACKQLVLAAVRAVGLAIMAFELVEEIASAILEPPAEAVPTSPEEALRQADPGVLAQVVAHSRALGNDAFQQKRFRGAMSPQYLRPVIK